MQKVQSESEQQYLEMINGLRSSAQELIDKTPPEPLRTKLMEFRDWLLVEANRVLVTVHR